MQKAVILRECVQKPNQSSLAGSEAKNPLPTSVSAMDMIGLSWLFFEED
ncbi:MAG: hypothetical protein ACE5RO_03545 [Candidatus Nitrosomaritimum yanchengensis]